MVKIVDNIDLGLFIVALLGIALRQLVVPWRLWLSMPPTISARPRQQVATGASALQLITLWQCSQASRCLLAYR